MRYAVNGDSFVPGKPRLWSDKQLFYGEGACKNLIKDRMERSGMRWTEQMAEAIVQLRAICLSGDFDHYWEFHIAQDQRRLYPAPWSVVPK